ncbi:MAG: MFS transporter, partial [Bradyrhizobium sp.]|nr:MFS transporter [Bradyrhizobium sp.]
APAFIVVAITSALSSFFFWQMPDDAGSEISGRKVAAIASRKGAEKGVEKAATKSASETTHDARDQRLG